MFRPPQLRPPLSSIVRQSSPRELSFMTTDHALLNMEAYQALNPPIDPRCCGRIQLAILNSDRYPGTISLQLALVESGVPRDRIEWLGSVTPGAGYRQTLDFPMRQPSLLQQFDGIKVVFRRARVRADRSARIEIERFVLIPASP